MEDIESALSGFSSCSSSKSDSADEYSGVEVLKDGVKEMVLVAENSVSFNATIPQLVANYINFA